MTDIAVIEVEADDAVEIVEVNFGATGPVGEAAFEDHGTVTSGTETLDRLNDVVVHRLVVGGNITIATDSWPSSGTYGEILVEQVNGGAHTITFSDTITWLTSGGAEPSWQASGTDFYVLFTHSGGTVIYGAVVSSGGGGGGGLDNVVEDATPQLGGDLDANGNNILFANNDGIYRGASARIIVGTSQTDGVDGWDDSVKINLDGGDLYPALLINTTVDGGTSGPHIVTYHNNPTPAANDELAGWWVYGEDSAGNLTQYGQVTHTATNVTNLSEASAWHYTNRIAGTVTRTCSIGDGVIIGSTTTYPGAGKLRVTNIELGHDTANTLSASGGVLSIEGTALLLSGGALGTPSSGTLSNCTGLPTIVAADEASDTSCFPVFFTAATGELGPKTNSSLTYNSSTGAFSIGTSAVLTAGSIELGHASANTLTAASGVLSVEGVPVAMTGKQTIWVPASAMTPAASNGAASTTRAINTITTGFLAFDQTTSESAYFNVTFPKSWNESTVTAQIYWTTTGGAGAETLEFEISGGCFANDAAINVTGIGTAVAHTDTWIADDDVHVTAEGSAITLSNAAVDTVAWFRIVRDVANDTLTADAELIGVKLFYSTDAGNDA
jgi:hypothetical protein